VRFARFAGGSPIASCFGASSCTEVLRVARSGSAAVSPINVPGPAGALDRESNTNCTIGK